MTREDIQYEILHFDPSNGTIKVKYFTEEFTEGLFMQFDVPIIDGKFANQDEINSFIESFKPVSQIERALLTKSLEIPVHLAEITIPTVEIPTSNTSPLTPDPEIEEIIERLLLEK
jgi:hypothetical protein